MSGSLGGRNIVHCASMSGVCVGVAPISSDAHASLFVAGALFVAGPSGELGSLDNVDQWGKPHIT